MHYNLKEDKMKAVRRIQKCIICGAEEEHFVIMSNFIGGTPDLDLRVRGSMADAGSEILMCSHCGYCNYDLEQAVQTRFVNNNHALELWKKYEKVQEILNSDYNETLKKYLIMAAQYSGNGNYENEWKMLLNAAWAADSKEEELKLKRAAIDVFIWKVLPAIRTKIFQVSDILRQLEYFDVAEDFIKAGEALLNLKDKDAKSLLKIAKFEKKLIKNKDTNIHNLSEIK